MRNIHSQKDASSLNRKKVKAIKRINTQQNKKEMGSFTGYSQFPTVVLQQADTGSRTTEGAVIKCQILVLGIQTTGGI